MTSIALIQPPVSVRVAKCPHLNWKISDSLTLSSGPRELSRGEILAARKGSLVAWHADNNLTPGVSHVYGGGRVAGSTLSPPPGPRSVLRGRKREKVRMMVVRLLCCLFTLIRNLPEAVLGLK